MGLGFFTGFAIAAFIVWKLTVMSAIKIVPFDQKINPQMKSINPISHPIQKKSYNKFHLVNQVYS